MTDDDTRQFHARVMTGDEFEARRSSKFTIESASRTRYKTKHTEIGDSGMSPAAPKIITPKLTDEQRKAAIEDVVARKKAAEAKSSEPPKGSKAEKLKQATSPGVVKPSKPERKVKIPKALNEGRVDDTDTVTEDPTSAMDDEVEENVKKPKKTKVEKDPSMLTIGDVARALGLDPKAARRRLRATGQSAQDGRWPKVKRGSKEHDALIVALQPEDEPEADTDDAQEDDGE